MDNIKDQRTHLGKHPYRDFWHLLQLIRDPSAFIAGMLFYMWIILTILQDQMIWFWLLGQIVLLIGYKFLIFDYFYRNHKEMFFMWDEHIKISLGNERIDKFLGFHH
jgi:hypothetical protein